MSTVILFGTLDTKGHEYAFLRQRLLTEGVQVLLMDVGVYPPTGVNPNISRTEVAAAAGADINDLAAGDRGEAVTAMSRGAAAYLQQLHRNGQMDAVFAMGGGGGTALAAHAMRALPLGVPKLILSTLAAGNTRPLVGTSDLTLMHSVVDVAGLNRITQPIMANAAAAAAGMARRTALPHQSSRPTLAATMFGVTTPCVQAARARLETAGFEVVIFHATGVGGESMEDLIRQAFFAGVLDVTTTELADELVGGVLSAGPQRLEAAGDAGVPQVVSLGALDMVNFGPWESVPQHWRNRRLHRHNDVVTLMRTSPAESAQLGALMARKLNASTGPVSLFIPLRGVSALAVEGQPFHDAEADTALFTAIRDNLNDDVELIELDMAVNDPAFADAMADKLLELCPPGDGAPKPFAGNNKQEKL